MVPTLMKTVEAFRKAGAPVAWTNVRAEQEAHKVVELTRGGADDVLEARPDRYSAVLLQDVPRQPRW
jgi:hypothetical protein